MRAGVKGGTALAALLLVLLLSALLGLLRGRRPPPRPAGPAGRAAGAPADSVWVALGEGAFRVMTTSSSSLEEPSGSLLPSVYDSSLLSWSAERAGRWLRRQAIRHAFTACLIPLHGSFAVPLEACDQSHPPGRCLVVDSMTSTQGRLIAVGIHELGGARGGMQQGPEFWPQAKADLLTF